MLCVSEIMPGWFVDIIQRGKTLLPLTVKLRVRSNIWGNSHAKLWYGFCFTWKQLALCGAVITAFGFLIAKKITKGNRAWNLFWENCRN